MKDNGRGKNWKNGEDQIAKIQMTVLKKDVEREGEREVEEKKENRPKKKSKAGKTKKEKQNNRRERKR